MPEHPRPILKLKVGKSLVEANSAKDASPTQTPTSTGTPKIKLKVSGSKPKPEPAEPASSKTAQSPAKPSPKIKLNTKPKEKPTKIKISKKRSHDAIAEPEQAETPTGGPKRLKFVSKAKTPHTPYVKLKPKGKPPPRPNGLAYDSEASDREDDPAIEEEFILRMIPGDDCEYVRKAIEEKKWGKRSQGGADIRLKFLQTDGRRATLTVKGTIYAATLVDMPCIVEGLKSWDRKAWYKAADICQMVLVLGTVKTEAEALSFPLPIKEVDKASYAYAHGLTPPLRWVRKRRFRPRVSTRTIEAVEDEVERLLRVDAEAEESVKYEVVDFDRLSRGPSARDDSEPDSDGYGEVDVDADGELVPEDGGYFGAEIADEDEANLAAEFEMAGSEDIMEGVEAATPAESSSVAPDTQNVTDSEAATPAAGATSKEDSGDEVSDDDDMDDIDEDAMEQRADLLRAREEIQDLENAIKGQIADMERLSNVILKRKKLEMIRSLKDDLERKKAAIGEGEDDLD